MSATCGSVSCARREHLVAVLIKAALDAAHELDMGHIVTAEVADRQEQIVNRVHAACEALGVEIENFEVPT